MILALTIGVMIAGSVFLMLQSDYLRVIFGFVLLGHAANLLLFAAGGLQRRGEPLGDNPDPAVTADPLPQAFVLTAIVIAFSITVYMLALAVTARRRQGEAGELDHHEEEPYAEELERAQATWEQDAADGDQDGYATWEDGR